MEGLQKLFCTVSMEAKIGSSGSSSSSSSSENQHNARGGSASLFSVDRSRVLVMVGRTPRQLVSLWTCSKLCAVCFVAGVFVGETLKRRVQRWASKLFQRLKDN